MGAKAEQSHEFTPPTTPKAVVSVSVAILAVCAAVAVPVLLAHGLSVVACAVFVGLCAFGFAASLALIPGTAVLCGEKGLYGRDINKTKTFIIPEALGLVTGTVYLTCVVLFSPFFPQMGEEYNAAMMAICFMILLGFADDVLDLRWRHKIFLSFLATVPLLVAYTGPTDIVVPLPLRGVLKMDFVPLGYLYHFYMSLIAVFCTNSINIYAGVNGLEVGQSVVIACSVIAFNVIELTHPTQSTSLNGQLLSIFLVFPFLATSLGLIVFNWYPSQVFVGDTYTYFAGMVFAVVGILGGFSKTMLLLFLPQLLNFIVSIPQLLHIIPCPRHRLPKLNAETGLLEGIKTNLTLINILLHVTGPLSEKTIARILVGLQVVSSAIGLTLRYQLASFFYYQ